jgi:ubiquitin carboxyl-terminal hydrolase 36/42
MLEPRQADIPALFLVLVVLPLVAYILLGKWSEATKKRERISLLAQVAAEENLRAETMAAANAIPLMASSKSGLLVCARCCAPATTRCARCKSVRYWYVLFLVYDCSNLFSLVLILTFPL